jgi:acyl carrier protein
MLDRHMDSSPSFAELALRRILKVAINLQDHQPINDELAFGVAPGWDSLAHVVVVTEIEKIIGRELPLDAIPELGVASRILAVLEEHFSTAGGSQ